MSDTEFEGYPNNFIEFNARGDFSGQGRLEFHSAVHNLDTHPGMALIVLTFVRMLLSLGFPISAVARAFPNFIQIEGGTPPPPDPTGEEDNFSSDTFRGTAPVASTDVSNAKTNSSAIQQQLAKAKEDEVRRHKMDAVMQFCKAESEDTEKLTKFIEQINSPDREFAKKVFLIFLEQMRIESLLDDLGKG